MQKCINAPAIFYFIRQCHNAPTIFYFIRQCHRQKYLQMFIILRIFNLIINKFYILLKLNKIS